MKNFQINSKPSKSGKRTVYFPTINGMRINSVNFIRKWEAILCAKTFLGA